MRFLALVFALVLGLANSGWAEERITYYGVDVTVNRDGSLDFAETITVVGENNEIRRGILRDVPVVNDIEGVRVNADFEVKSVTRDGKAEPYTLQRSGDLITVCIGDPSVFIGAGTFTYVIRYRISHQLLFFPDRDVLVWNAVGTGWSFPIEIAEITLHLPAGTQVVTFRGTTGRHGASGKDYLLSDGPAGDFVVTTTRRLEPSEGLWIFIAWKSGVIARGSQDL